MQILGPKKMGERSAQVGLFSGLFQHAARVLQALLWPGGDGHLTMDSEIQNRI
jgi:hypothetical protein